MKLRASNVPFRNIIFSLSTSVLVRFSGLLVTTVIVKQFGQEVFGEYSYLVNTALLLMTVSMMATNQIFTRNIARNEGGQESICDYIYFVAILYFVVFFLFFISTIVFSELRFLNDYLFGIFSVSFLEVLNLTFIAFYSGKERFELILKIKLVFALVLIGLVLLSSALDFYFGVYPYICASLSSVVLFVWFLREEFCYLTFKKTIFDFKAFFLNYVTPSLPIFVSGLMVTPVQWYLSNRIIASGGFSELGMFNISMQFRMIVIMVTASIATALLPRLAATKDKNIVREILSGSYKVTALISILMTLIIVILMRFILTFYDVNFSEVDLVSSYMIIISSIPMALYNIYAQFLITESKTKVLLFLNFSWGTCVLSMTLFFEIIDSERASLIILVSYVMLAFLSLFSSRFRRES